MDGNILIYLAVVIGILVIIAALIRAGFGNSRKDDRRVCAGVTYLSCIFCGKCVQLCQDKPKPPVQQRPVRNVAAKMFLSVVFVIVLFIGFFLFNVYVQWRVRKSAAAASHQHDDIFNISSRVQQNQDHPWPPHDAHISIDHFNIMDMNKPMYDDAPPSYDEVMKTLQQAQSGEGSTPVQVVVEAPKTTATQGVATPRVS